MRILAIAMLALPACSDPVDATAHPPIPAATYQQWKKIEVHGDLPGHGGDTYRIIYANPIAQSFEGGQYPSGPDDASTSILVKEVHDLAGTDSAPAPGALQYVAVMRRLPGAAPQGLSEEGGWLFSYTTSPGGSEQHASYCWDACHVDAPYHGAWFDYSK